MTRSIKSAWLPLSLAAAAMLALVGWLAVAGLAQAGVSSVSIESKTVNPGATVTVALSAVATSPGIGAFQVAVEYNDALLDIVSCAKSTNADLDMALCNKDYVAGNGTTGTAFFTGASTGGATGTVALGSITFTAGNTPGTANLTVTIQKLADPSTAAITVTPTSGAITIAAPATPSPTPVPATPSPTPGALPKTGGSPSDGTSLTPWLLAVLGLAVVSGGAWAVARTRR